MKAAHGDFMETVIGAVVGVALIVVTRTYLGSRREAHVGSLRGARGMTAVLVIGIMTVHSFTEGVAIGVSFAGEESLGILIALAIAIHNVPEGVAVSLALVPFGESPRSAALWSIFSSLPSPCWRCQPSSRWKPSSPYCLRASASREERWCEWCSRS